MSALGQKQTYAAQQVMSAYSQLRLQKRIFAFRHVRITPKSRHVQCGSACPLRANSGLMQRSKKISLFDHLVGKPKKGFLYF
jgi:hypothetical protein